VNNSTDIKNKSIGSVKWTILSEFFSRAISPLTFIILAQILSPHDFGVLAVAQIAITFCSLFWDAGLQKALVQTDETLDKASNAVFWVNLALGLVIYALLFFIAPFLSIFFTVPSACPVLRVLGLQIIFGALSTVPQGRFFRELNFKLLFWARLATAAIPAMVAIPLAYLGYGVWALVLSSLAGNIINLAILWVRCDWRPQLSFDAAIARKMANFGSWIVADSLIGWFIAQGDGAVVGRYLGVRNLGLYRTGKNMIDVLFGLTLNPIYPILYPAFAAMHNDKEALSAFLYKINRIIMALTLPIGAGIMCIATPLTAVILGEKWHGIEVVLSIMGMQTALSWLVGANPEIYRAMGRPDIQTKIGLLSAPLYLFVYVIVAQFGLTAFLWARLGLSLLVLPIHIWMAVKMLNLSYLYLWQWGKPMFIATTFMVAAILGTKWILEMGHFTHPPIIDLAAFTISGLVIYIGSLWLLDKTFVLQSKGLIKKALFI